MIKCVSGMMLGAAMVVPHAAVAQSRGPAPAAVQEAAGQAQADRAERAARRFGAGVQGGVGLDPELVDVGAHVTFGPVFSRALSVRPGIELGLGEITTLFAINVDVLYALDNDGRTWTPYLGAGPSFGLSHRGFETDDVEHVTVTDGDSSTEERSRFDFGDTDFNGGMNFIAGVRKARGLFLEMRATAWGVSNIRLLAGFNF